MPSADASPNFRMLMDFGHVWVPTGLATSGRGRFCVEGAAASIGVLVHHVEVVLITVRHLVVPSRQAEDRADLGRTGDEA